MTTTHAPQPGPTPSEFMEHGIHVFTVATPRSQTIEDWVQSIAKETGLRMDWRMVGGHSAVLVLGDRDACIRGRSACLAALDRLGDMYEACPYNWSPGAKREDIYWRTVEF